MKKLRLDLERIYDQLMFRILNELFKKLGCVKICVARRLRQHNGELAGGAKSTRGGRPWSLVCTMRGLSSRSEGIPLLGK